VIAEVVVSMKVHYHTSHPTYCVEATPWGWAVAPECVPEKVEVCSERIVAEVWFAPNLDALIGHLKDLKVSESDLEEFKRLIPQGQHGG